MTMKRIAMPAVVSADEWKIARARLLEKEKRATRLLDALAAERRRLPMVRLDQDYVFSGARGKVSLANLFSGRAGN